MYSGHPATEYCPEAETGMSSIIQTSSPALSDQRSCGACSTHFLGILDVHKSAGSVTCASMSMIGVLCKVSLMTSSDRSDACQTRSKPEAWNSGRQVPYP